MRIEMDEFGVLQLIPEGSLEVYALHQWVNQAWIVQKDDVRCESGHWRGSKLVVWSAVES